MQSSTPTKGQHMSERARTLKESFVKAILDGVREKMERHSTRVISGIDVEEVSPSHLAVTVHYVTEEPKTYDVRVSERRA
jgi:hypothetical protein